MKSHTRLVCYNLAWKMEYSAHNTETPGMILVRLFVLGFPFLFAAIIGVDMVLVSLVLQRKPMGEQEKRCKTDLLREKVLTSGA